ncbi:hypothetical protein DWG18_12545 [Lysobacter sp. TY2-98]|uniref:hypothetical protein n=1 Tax=Lysobacter sp. TY2-98 TaxID=2290922 RepID=UPI000E206809|nr:hypothetical protein [Lysobacter sp. TY2-98]AXK73024.1 hypothetical protein DWG18_12545 [Lysobacter sp. TY2-98]
MRSIPPPRRLIACAVALVVLVALTGALFLLHRSNGGWSTPLGSVEILDLLAVAIAMGVGGVIARQGFGIAAVGLVLLIGITSSMAAYGGAPAVHGGAVHWLLRNTALQLVLSAIVAWGAAVAGERIAARRRTGSA